MPESNLKLHHERALPIWSPVTKPPVPPSKLNNFWNHVAPFHPAPTQWTPRSFWT